MNHPQRHQNQAGFSILEVAISLSLFAIGMTVVLSAMGTASNHANGSIAKALSDTDNSEVIPKLSALFTESSISHIDTSARILDVASATSFTTDRFTYLGMKQCSSPTCEFHTRRNFDVVDEHIHCGYEYRTGMGVPSTTRGKVWPAKAQTCEYDGSQLLNFAALDGVKFLAARSNGEFALLNNRPHWNTMVFVFPRVNSDGYCDLTVHELRLSDVLDAAAASLTWTRWANEDVSFVELLDFGTDGTQDGTPDGSAPVDINSCDADIEIFSTATNQNDLKVIFSKQLGTPASGVYRKVEIDINLNTSVIGFNFHHQDSIGTSWQSSGTVTRPCEVLTTRLTEFAVTTQASSPHDAANNPLGVSDGVVRIHLVTTQEYRESGTNGHRHAVNTFEVRPRN